MIGDNEYIYKRYIMNRGIIKNLEVENIIKKDSVIPTKPNNKEGMDIILIYNLDTNLLRYEYIETIQNEKIQ